MPTEASAGPAIDDSPAILVACTDANVLLSALAFGGSPQQVVDRLLGGEFLHVTGPNILAEVRRNAIGKLRLTAVEVDMFLDNIRNASTEYVPHGRHEYIKHAKDNLVLEVALAGGCSVLITGDRRHLLPLSPFHSMVIEPPSAFLGRLDRNRRD